MQIIHIKRGSEHRVSSAVFPSAISPPFSTLLCGIEAMRDRKRGVLPILAVDRFDVTNREPSLEPYLCRFTTVSVYLFIFKKKKNQEILSDLHLLCVTPAPSRKKAWKTCVPSMQIEYNLPLFIFLFPRMTAIVVRSRKDRCFLGSCGHVPAII